MNYTVKKYLPYGTALLFIYFLAWQTGTLIYALLATVPVIIFRYYAPSIGWIKPLGLSLFLCVIWYLGNALSFLTLAPISSLGFKKSAAEIFTDLIRHPEIIGKALLYSLYRTHLILCLGALITTVIAFSNTPTGRGLGLHRLFEVPGGFTISKSTTMGSARWSTERELRNYFKTSGPGLILGKNDNGDPYILPYDNDQFDYKRNQNIIVFGATGSGKTESFVKPNILQADTSFVITDPKEEIYNELAGYLEMKGYNVYKFNLINMRDTHRWNPLVKKDGTCDLSIQDAVLMASSIIRNTKDPLEKTKDPFWDKAEQALLTSLILYAVNHFKEEKNFANILKFAVGRTPGSLEYDFGRLDPSDPARASFNVYAQAPEKVRGSIIISLGTRLQLFQDDALADLTARSEFDISELGREKTAIFVILSDYDDTYNSISALFFTQAFQELYRLASANGGRLPVFTRFMMDEFCNIGFIPGYTVKLSTMRSRGISAQMIVQSLGQLENRYPFGLSGEIIGNCDTRLLLGANDTATAKYFTELIGRTTVEQETRSRSDRVVIDAGQVSEREMSRELITPDEILRLDNREALLVVRGGYPAKIKKLHYSEHPEAKILRKIQKPNRETEKENKSTAQSIEEELITEINRNSEQSIQPSDPIQDLPIPEEDFQP